MPSVDGHMFLNALDNVCIMGGSYCPYGQVSVELHACNSVVVLLCTAVMASICVLQHVDLCCWTCVIHQCLFPRFYFQKCQNWHTAFSRKKRQALC